MNANIKITDNQAIVTPINNLSGAEVMATDLRASVSLVMAGLAAKGETVINRLYHLDRGYENLETKLTAVGAHIIRQQKSAPKVMNKYKHLSYIC